MKDESAERLRRLEAHVTHLEHQIEQINEVVVDQSRLLSRLKKEVQRQSESLQTRELERIQAHNQKPPHYL